MLSSEVKQGCSGIRVKSFIVITDFLNVDIAKIEKKSTQGGKTKTVLRRA